MTCGNGLSSRLKVKGFTYVQGARYNEWFHQILKRSLWQGSNLQALRSVDFSWDIYSDQPQRSEAPEFPVNQQQAEGMIECLRRTIRRCFHENARLLMLLPDFYFGDGSLHNLFECAYVGGTCIAAPHLRVDSESFRRHLPPGDVANAELVGLVLKCPWKGTRQFFINSDPSLTYFGGVLIKRLDECLYVMQHMLPNYFLAAFLKDDVEYFERATSLMAWDWDWPSKVAREGRHRVVCSSDLFFMAEVTDDDGSKTFTSPPMTHADSFYESKVHNRFNKAMLCTLRAAPF
jgi:hypothetical protein